MNTHVLLSLVDELISTEAQALSSEAASHGNDPYFSGFVFAVIEVLSVLVFIAIVLKKSDNETKFIRSRSAIRFRKLPPKAEFDNITTVTTDETSQDDKNYSPFSGEIDYGKQGESIESQPVGEVYSPFTGMEYDSDDADDGTVFDIATEKAPDIGLPGADEERVYEDPAEPLSELVPEGTPPALETLERDEADELQTEGRTITDLLKPGDEIPEVERGKEPKTTAPSIYDTVNSN